jgi:hypothetical protein
MSGNYAVHKRTANYKCWELRRIDKKASSTYSVLVSSQASSPLIHKTLTHKHEGGDNRACSECD